MIKADGIKAVFRGKSKYSKSRKEWVGGKQIEIPDGEYLFEKDVISFDEEGSPLILGSKCLEPANAMSNFVGLREGADDAVISIIPTNDWIAWRKDEAGDWWPSRLCAWALLANGSVVAMDSDDLGLVDKLEDDARVRHASEGPPNESATSQSGDHPAGTSAGLL